ncbi:hypothetical protein [Kineococcus rubinsiae]|uniref:hypothetical protein n=1 Tax=Kineococcus rubinsiae TaxID=2609562 RepID=UPI00142FBE7C|nr:hypothetical protein [Kineococcus rubinsiae]NIZ92771.1 hypothetical protein [Kineococcus rubinsiae]
MPVARATGRTLLRAGRLLTAALVALVVAAGLTAGAPRAEAATPPPASSFVQRSGSGLTLAGAPFRFSGTNVYWLGLDDNVRDAAGAPTYPTRFRVDDAFRAAQAAGGTVVRTWGGLVGCGRCIEPTRGTFQDSAFASLDYAVATAARYRQRLVVTLVDNWDYYHGSKNTFTGWRGLGESAFFSDPGVIADYQAYITHVVEHVNPYTGLRYADDPTIMGWETGNEMWCQTCAGNHWDGSWTRAVADHLDRVAPKQLVVDGHGTDPSCRTGCLHEPSLDIASVDVVDDHFYPMQLDRVRSSAATAARHGKAYLVGEYAWNGARGGEPLATFLDAVRTSGAAGALTWSVVAHHDTAGFVDHDDGYQYFFPGRTADERARTGTLQAFARAVGAPEPPRWAIPPTPCGVTVTRTASGQALSWRGASPAVVYVVQRLDRTTPGATWQTLTWEATDQRVANGPLWTDSSAAARSIGVAAYRVAGLSASRVLGGFSASADTGTRTACAA